MAAIAPVTWWRRPVFGVRDVGILTVGFTLLLSAAGVYDLDQQASIWAALAALAMVVPVAFARRAPVPAAAAQAVGSLANGLAFGSLVRCGFGLPAAFYVAFAVGERTTGRARSAGVACVLGGLLIQCSFDSRIHAISFVQMGPVSLLFLGAGVLVRSRAARLARLRGRNAELREQREQTALLAVANDRERIRTDLDEVLLDRIGHIARTAEAGRGDGTSSALSLAEIELSGRSALDSMRDVVGTMRSAPTDPEPRLDALPDLIRSATTSRARLTVEGDPRLLAASLELSAYRIVEHLLAALEDDPDVRVQIRVTFTTDALELLVSGPAVPEPGRSKAVSLVRDRAALHGGSVGTAEPAGAWEAQVVLPLISSYA